MRVFAKKQVASEKIAIASYVRILFFSRRYVHVSCQASWIVRCFDFGRTLPGTILRGPRRSLQPLERGKHASTFVFSTQRAPVTLGPSIPPYTSRLPGMAVEFAMISLSSLY